MQDNSPANSTDLVQITNPEQTHDGNVVQPSQNGSKNVGSAETSQPVFKEPSK